MKKSIQITVSGKVQNVGFRYYTRKAAHESGIKGFVRNQSDGSVYIEAEGDDQSLSSFIAWCHQGPAWARVDSVDINDQPVQEYREFIVR
jgi:acylphosphatase